MILEWVSFRNEFLSRMKFVLHSHDKIDQLRHLENNCFVPRFENNTHAPLAPRLHGNGVRFQFIWYQNEISYQNENFIRIENRNELIPEWLVGEQYFISVSCKQIQRNIYGDGMNSFWNESHSVIMWTAPKLCFSLLVLTKKLKVIVKSYKTQDNLCARG